MSARTSLLLSGILGLAASHALACGVCVEDKVAATYDHAIASMARARHYDVVFAQIAGPDPGPALAQAAADAVRQLHGVQAETIRTSAEPATVSFALDPHAQDSAQAMAAIQRALAPRQMTVEILRVLRQGEFADR